MPRMGQLFHARRVCSAQRFRNLRQANYRSPSFMNPGPVDPAVDPATLERIKTIFRRDLKLGPDIPIADDMPFFGGDVDLDSLDMLLLVTSIEKEFGIK